MPTSSSDGSKTSWQSQPLVGDILGTAKSVFQNPNAWQPDTRSYVTPFSTQTRTGLTGLQNTAKGATGAFTQNFNNISALNKDAGLNSLQDKQVGSWQKIANGNGLNSMQQQAANWLKPIANGDYMQGNPYLNDIINKNAEDIRYQSGLAASGMGRYGSGGHEGVQAKAIGDMASNLRYQNYGDEANRRDAAINSYFNAGSTGNQQRMDAVNNLFNAGQQQRQNIMNGTSALTDAYNARTMPYQTQLGVGARYEDQNNKILQDQARIFQDKQNAYTAPINWLGNLASAFQGGQQIQTGSTPRNPVASGLGGALAGNSLFGLPGAVLGGLGGTFF